MQERFVSWPALLALRKKRTPNKQRAAQLYKMVMNWAQVTQKKQQQA